MNFKNLKKKETFSQEFDRNDREKNQKARLLKENVNEVPVKKSFKKIISETCKKVVEKINHVVEIVKSRIFKSYDDSELFNGLSRGRRRKLIRNGFVYEGENGVVILMAAPTPENVITGIIGKIKKADRYDRALEIINACAISTYVTIAPADITLYRGHLTTFNAVGTPAQKSARWAIVYDDLKILLSTFQLAATANQPNAIVILESGAFKIKNIGGNSKRQFNLFDGAESGTVRLEGQAGGKKKHLHDWFISYDLGVTWTRLQPTISGETLAIGLTVGKTVWFGHQIIDKNGIVDGSYDKKSIVVK